MDLSIREAAALLGKSERTVRYMASHGRLPAHRAGNRWIIRGDQLEVAGDAQRDQVQHVRERLESALDRAAPAASTGEKRPFYSARDLDAHRTAAEVFVALTRLAADHPEAQGALGACNDSLRAFLRLVTDGCHQFHPQRKLDCFIRARSTLSSTVADLVCFNLIHPEPGVGLLADRLERDALGALRGLLRRAEKRGA